MFLIPSLSEAVSLASVPHRQAVTTCCSKPGLLVGARPLMRSPFLKCSLPYGSLLSQIVPATYSAVAGLYLCMVPHTTSPVCFVVFQMWPLLNCHLSFAETVALLRGATQISLPSHQIHVLYLQKAYQFFMVSVKCSHKLSIPVPWFLSEPPG